MLLRICKYFFGILIFGSGAARIRIRNNFFLSCDWSLCSYRQLLLLLTSLVFQTFLASLLLLAFLLLFAYLLLSAVPAVNWLPFYC